MTCTLYPCVIESHAFSTIIANHGVPKNLHLVAIHSKCNPKLLINQIISNCEWQEVSSFHTSAYSCIYATHSLILYIHWKCCMSTTIIKSQSMSLICMFSVIYQVAARKSLHNFCDSPCRSWRMRNSIQSMSMHMCRGHCLAPSWVRWSCWPLTSWPMCTWLHRKL